MSEEIILSVNGKPHKVQAEPETALLYVLRNELGLTGPQFGCGEETCGACMVLVGDEATPSCKLAVSKVRQSRITTLEGLILRKDFYAKEARLRTAKRQMIDKSSVRVNNLTSKRVSLVGARPIDVYSCLQGVLQ